MTQEERIRNLMHRLRRCYRFLHSRSDGGKSSQLHLLRELRYHGEMTQRMLQEHMKIQQSSLSELVKKLEEQGVITRSICPTDRRQILISLTDAGIALSEEAEAANLQQNIAFLQVLTDQEQETLLELVTKLDESWTAQYPRTSCVQKGDAQK